jgi:hypothetical protein
VTSLYVWLKFLHLLGLGVFLMGHGVSAGASIVLRGRPLDTLSRSLLQVSIRSESVAFPGLLLVLVTGVWMGFLGSWWRTGWIWTTIAILVLVTVLMGFWADPYRRARGTQEDSQDRAGDVALARTRPLTMLWVGVVALVAMLFLMVFKPF